MFHHTTLSDMCCIVKNYLNNIWRKKMNKDRIRFKQDDYHLDEIDKIENIEWCIEKYGCGPTSIANILINFGFNINPIYTKNFI